MPRVTQTDPSAVAISAIEQDLAKELGSELLASKKLIDVLMSHSLLDPEQERNLIRTHHTKQEELDFIFQDEIERNGAVSLERRDEIKKLQEQIHETEATLLKHNWRWIFTNAKDFFKYVYHFQNLSDRKLLFAGAKGFLEGLRKFKFELGNKLLTCVTPWIRGAMKATINDERKMHLNLRDINDKNLFNRVEKAFLSKNHVSEVDYTQLAKDLGIEFEHLAQFAKELGLGRFTSLSHSSDSKPSLANIIAAQIQDSTLDDNDSLKIASKKLTPKERIILALRYGSKDLASAEDLQTLQEKYPKLKSVDLGSSHTLPEIGSIFGVVKQRISKVEEEILDQLTASLEKYQPKFHWIPDSTDVKGLKQLFWYVFDNKQRIFTKPEEFYRGLLHRLTLERLHYRNRMHSVLTPKEKEILELRLGLVNGCKGGLGDVAMLLYEKRGGKNVDRVVKAIRIVESKAIRKIYTFFNAKNPTELKGFFSPELKNETKTPYYRNLMIEAFGKYLSS